MIHSTIGAATPVRRVLVVCDDRLIATVVGRLLIALEYAPICVGTGTEAVRTLGSRVFELVVAAHEGSPFNGIALYDFLLESQAYRAIPFVLMVTPDAREKLRSGRSKIPVMLSLPFGQIALQRAIARAKDPSIPEDAEVVEI